MNSEGLGNIIIGKNSIIDPSVQVTFNGPGELVVGRYAQIGRDVKIVINDGCVKIGDWTTVHSNSLLLCKNKLSIGRHCWFGQNTILDGTGGLTIDDGVRVGMYSQIWTHVAAGERIEGCRLFGEKPTIIEKDVWLVGSCTVGSGVTIGEKVICMNGSNVTKSIPANTTAMGVPAQVREGLNFYKVPTLEKKFMMMAEWIKEFAAQRGMAQTIADDQITIESDQEQLLICKDSRTFNHLLAKYADTIPVLCIETKAYRVTYSVIEEALIRWLAGNKARFYPID